MAGIRRVNTYSIQLRGKYWRFVYLANKSALYYIGNSKETHAVSLLEHFIDVFHEPLILSLPVLVGLYYFLFTFRSLLYRLPDV